MLRVPVKAVNVTIPMPHGSLIAMWSVGATAITSVPPTTTISIMLICAVMVVPKIIVGVPRGKRHANLGCSST